MPKYNVSEIFHTLQGEGPNTGVPSIFVRFSGCNLRCEWGKDRCDTPYTSWNPEVNLMSIQDLVSAIDKISEEHECIYIVLTGGEPTLQPLDALCDILKQKDYFIAIETNGTGHIPDSIDLIVSSPKLSDSTPAEGTERTIHQANRDKARKNLKELVSKVPEKIFLKFVISKKTELQEIANFCREVDALQTQVYFMPEGITRDDILENQLFVAEMAKRAGVNFTTRLHVLLWGHTRGT